MSGRPREAGALTWGQAAQRALIEQGIACGDPHDVIAAALNVPVEHVDKVRADMDEIARETP